MAAKKKAKKATKKKTAKKKTDQKLSEEELKKMKEIQETKDDVKDDILFRTSEEDKKKKRVGRAGQYAQAQPTRFCLSLFCLSLRPLRPLR